MNKAKKCNKGFPCGNACISKLDKCWANLSSDKQKLFETFSQFCNRIVGIGNEMESSIPVQQQQDLVFSQNKNAFKTLEGALGMQAYFSEKYRDINKYFYDEKYRKEAPEEIKILAEGALKGFYEMPDYSLSEIQTHYKAKGIDYNGVEVFRGMTFWDVDKLNNFVSNHPLGEEISYPSFTSTSVANPNNSKAKKVHGGWGSKPVQIKILQKSQTSGKWVDPRKRQKDEGEILYPPNQSFKVLKVDTTYVERLPDRLRDPLLNLFLPTADGGGIGNITLKSILGDLDPKYILSSNDYLWFVNLLKARGYPPLDISNIDLPLSNFISLGKAGSRLDFFNKVCESLKNQVRLDEKTNVKDIISANILLQEV